MLTWTKSLAQTSSLNWNRVFTFRPNLKIEIEMGHYLIKTVDSFRELNECFKLRYNVFFNEFQSIEGTGLDIDSFDGHYDHLAIIDQRTGKIIGTYRLRIQRGPKKSYTAEEFELEKLFELRGPFLELGRACIHKDYRKGAVITLLWRGIAEYMKKSKARILFGCSSVKVDNARDAALIYKFMQQENMTSEKEMAYPTQKFTLLGLTAWMDYFKTPLSQQHAEEANNLIPPLLKSYIKMGAKVVAEPAFDYEFNCIDMLTVLKKEDMDKVLANKFGINA